MKYLQTYFPIILMYAVLGIMYLTLIALKFFDRKKKKRSPFTGNFLRSPGESLNEKILEISDELVVYSAILMMLPFMMSSMYLSDLYFRKAPLNLSIAFVYIVMGVIMVGYCLFKSVKFINLRRVMRLGYEGEIAVGQELNQMMRQGYYVYHDFIADKFNIDHIVVGPAGVFAIETKARSKPTSNDKAADAKVIYNGESIKFPTWEETKPLEQSKNQAAWLEKWLSSATGEPVPVRPVVALPGWFVTRVAKEGIPVINPKQFSGLAKYFVGQGLNESQIKRIVHQIDQRCRNVEPRAVK